MASKQPTGRRRKWRSRAVNVLLFVAAMTAVRAWQQRDMVSGPAPQLQGITLAGLPYLLPVHPGHSVLVQFWASWCPVCRAEQDAIASLAQHDPNVITVAMQSGKSEEVVQHMQAQGLSFPVLNDADGSISRAWGVHAVPVSFIIAPDGNVKFIEIGYTTGIGLKLRKWLAGINLPL